MAFNLFSTEERSEKSLAKLSLHIRRSQKNSAVNPLLFPLIHPVITALCLAYMGDALLAWLPSMHKISSGSCKAHSLQAWQSQVEQLSEWKPPCPWDWDAPLRTDVCSSWLLAMEVFVRAQRVKNEAFGNHYRDRPTYIFTALLWLIFQKTGRKGSRYSTSSFQTHIYSECMQIWG